MRRAALYMRVSTLDQLLADARRGQFDVLMVWACDRLNIEFVSFRENLDTGGPLGRAIVVIISVVAEPLRSLIVERVRAGMRRARWAVPSSSSSRSSPSYK